MARSREPARARVAAEADNGSETDPNSTRPARGAALVATRAVHSRLQRLTPISLAIHHWPTPARKKDATTVSLAPFTTPASSVAKAGSGWRWPVYGSARNGEPPLSIPFHKLHSPQSPTTSQKWKA